MDKVVVIIDDSFAVRQVSKILVSRYLNTPEHKVSIFSSDNGVEGLGYIFVTKPDLVVLDTTLPKYSGREVLDYLVQNERIVNSSTKYIALTTEKKDIKLPPNFQIINKTSTRFYKTLTREIAGEQTSLQEGVVYDLAGAVTKLSVKGEFLRSKTRSVFSNLRLAVYEIWATFLLGLLILLNGEIKDTNSLQSKLDRTEYRRKYYPTVVGGLSSLFIVGITLSLFLYSQFLLYEKSGTEAKAAYAWNETTLEGLSKSDISLYYADMDDDGSHIIGVGFYKTGDHPYSGFNENVFISTDYGETWVINNPEGTSINYYFTKVATNEDGSQFLYWSGGSHFYQPHVPAAYSLSNPTGNWVASFPVGPELDPQQYHIDIQSSDDNSLLVLSMNDLLEETTELYTSDNFGETWSLSTTFDPGIGDNLLRLSGDGSTIVTLSNSDSPRLAYVSTNGGLSWISHTLANLGTSYDLLNFVVSADGSTIVITGKSGSSYYLYLSTDNGVTLEEVPGRIGVVNEIDLVLSDDGSTILVRTQSGTYPNYVYTLHLSTDSGENWAEVDPSGEGGYYGFGNLYRANSNYNTYWPESIPINSDGSVIVVYGYVSSSSPRAYVSTDNGDSWSTVPLSHNLYTILANSDGSNVFLLGNNDNYARITTISLDSELTQTTHNLEAYIYAGGVSAIKSKDNQKILTIPFAAEGFSPRLSHLSANSGQSFEHISISLPVPVEWEEIQMDDSGANLVAIGYVDDASALFISHDYGDSWTQTDPSDDEYSDIDWYSPVISSSGSQILMTGYSDEENKELSYLSTNGGSSWVLIDPSNGQYNLVPTMSADGSHIILLGWDDDSESSIVYLSTNSGSSWTLVDPSNGANIGWEFAAINSSGSHIILPPAWGEDWEANVAYISTNHGDSWIQTDPTNGGTEYIGWNSAAVSGNGSHIFLFGQNQQDDSSVVYLSTDSGSSWSLIDPSNGGNIDWHGTREMSSDGSAIILQGYSTDTSSYGLYFSTDSAASWSLIDFEDISPSLEDFSLGSFAIDNNGSSIVIVGEGSPAGIVVSHDGGNTWSIIDPTGGAATYSEWNEVSINADGSYITVAGGWEDEEETYHSNSMFIGFDPEAVDPTPTPTETPVPTNTPEPTLTNTPVPTNTPGLSSTPIPNPTNTNVPGATIPVPTSAHTPGLTPSGSLAPSTTPLVTVTTDPALEPTASLEFTPTTTSTLIIITPTIAVPSSEDPDTSYTSKYIPTQDSVFNLPIVKSLAISVSESVDNIKQSSPAASAVFETVGSINGRVRPLVDNLNYLLSLQFIGSQTAVTGVTSINLLLLAAPAIAATFAQPRIMYYALAWFWRRKDRKPWGIVHDKFSNSPVAFARVTLTQDGKVVDSQTTDLQGKYGFVVDKGIYQIYISHSEYLDHSQTIKVNYDNQILSTDFELSPKEHADFSSALSWNYYQVKKFVRKNLFVLNTIIFSTGFVYTLFALTNAFTFFNFAILSFYILQIVLIIIFHFTRDKEWGEVLDSATGSPVAGAIVRLFDDDRQLDVAITDSKGRYNFVLEPGTYYISVSSAGYVFPTQDSKGVVKNKLGKKVMKFTVQDQQRLNVKLYMQKYTNGRPLTHTQAILSPFS